MTNKHILVLGSGSVGKRHMSNLTALGCRISAMDPRQDRLDEAGGQVDLVDRYTDTEQIDGAWGNYDGVVVASPPTYHVAQTVAAIEADVPVLLEKPLCAGLEDARRLRSALQKHGEARVVMGYTYRWWPPLADFRRRIGEVGKPLHAKFDMSAHLADWHPWEPYQDFFMASKELGGGALLDESHFLDLMLWFFGMPEKIYGRSEKLSSLDITTDDNVDIVAAYADGLRVNIHLDLFGRPHRKDISVSGEQGSLEWCFDPNRVRFSDKMVGDWNELHYEFERNDMFVKVAEEFLSLIDGHLKAPSCTLAEGIDVMRMIEAVRISTAEGREVALAEIGSS